MRDLHPTRSTEESVMQTGSPSRGVESSPRSGEAAGSETA